MASGAHTPSPTISGAITVLSPVTLPLTTNKGQKIDALLSDKSIDVIFKRAYNDTIRTLFGKRGKNMKTVNMGSKYSHRVTLRLSEEQYNFLIQVSELLGVSPSDYLRMVVNSGMIQFSGNNMKGLVGTNENVKTDSHDIV